MPIQRGLHPAPACASDAAPAPLRVKVATQEWEFEEIHRLNHLTFVTEIPQHERQGSGVLVDKFHKENTYFIALKESELVGMLAIRGKRPFSLDHKLPNVDSYLPPGRCICEVRLLAIAKPYRSGRVLQRLLASLWQYCFQEGFDAAVISGTTGQLKMYRRLGFVPFGPVVGSAGAQFQPMLVTRERAAGVFQRLCRPSPDCAQGRVSTPVNLLPGPADVRRTVRKRLFEPAESHRSALFAADFARAQDQLCRLTRAARAEILLGTGTLANDAIAAQLSLTSAPGLILTNGEFGDRLVDHATRFGLRHDVMRSPWGTPFDMCAVEERCSQQPPPGWLWFVHLETSTGVLNDLPALTALCRRAGVKICVDAVSSTGIVPVDLRNAWFGSAVSGKGLRSFAGLAIVFYNHPLQVAHSLPRYLDLGLYAREDGVPFTHSSNLVRALKAAMEKVDWQERFKSVARQSACLRSHLRARGFDMVAAEASAAPGILTIQVPAGISSVRLGEDLANEGFLLAAHSGYLRRRNWIQVSLMSQPPDHHLRAMAEALRRRCSPGIRE